MNLFKQTAIGVDIADHSIEVAELVKGNGQIKVNSLGRYKLASGIVERGEIRDTAKLMAVLRDALSANRLKSTKFKELVFGLPEGQVYSHVFVLGSGERLPSSAEKIRSRATQEARENIPLDPSDLFVTYKVLDNRLSGASVLVVGVSQALLNNWRKLFAQLGFAIRFDLETVALFRAIGPAFGAKKKTVAVVDLGAVSTRISIFDHGDLRYSRSLDYGIELLNASLVNDLKMTLPAIEKAKEEIGLTDPDSKLFTVLLKGLSPLRDELKLTLDYYEKWSGRKLEHLLVAGGGGNLRGLTDYLQSNLELPTSVGHSLLIKQPLVYLEAIGLALKQFTPTTDADLEFNLGSRRRHGSSSPFYLVLLLVIIAAGWFGYSAWPWFPPTEVVETPPPVVSPEVIFAPPVEEQPAPPTTPPPSSSIRMGAVANTPTGWLNVRAGASTDYRVITKINPGQVYPLLEENNDWYKIELSIDGEKTEGWVSSQYIIINN